MTGDIRTFSVVQGPPSGCLTLIILASLFFGIGGPVIFTAQYLWGPLGFFGAFIVVAILLNWFVSKWLLAQTTVTADDLGLTIEVTRAGLGNPLCSIFFSWGQLEGFKYSSGGRGAASLILHKIDGSKISLQANEVYTLYQYLKQICPEKELHYWFWRSKNG